MSMRDIDKGMAGRLSHKVVLRSIHETDSEFSDAFLKIDDAIGNATDSDLILSLEDLKTQGCTWVDYRLGFGYDDVLMMDLYRGIKRAGLAYKDVIDEAIKMGKRPC